MTETFGEIRRTFGQQLRTADHDEVGKVLEAADAARQELLGQLSDSELVELKAALDAESDALVIEQDGERITDPATAKEYLSIKLDATDVGHMIYLRGLAARNAGAGFSPEE